MDFKTTVAQLFPETADVKNSAWFKAMSPNAQQKYVANHPSKRSASRKRQGHGAFATFHLNKIDQHHKALTKHSKAWSDALLHGDKDKADNHYKAAMLHKRIAEGHSTQYAKHIVRS